MGNARQCGDSGIRTTQAGPISATTLTAVRINRPRRREPNTDTGVAKVADPPHSVEI